MDRAGYLLAAAALSAIHASPAYAAKSAAELNAIASLRYQSAQTQVVAAQVSDAKILALRGQVEASEAALARVRGQLKAADAAGRQSKAEIARLNGEIDGLLDRLAKAKTDFTDELARRDADYARDIAVLQTAGEQLLATPEGLRALELYNAGGPGAFEAADAVLGQIEEARAKAREEAALVQQAEDRRARARLALDARDRGLTTTPVAIERWEAVVATGKGVMRDWVNLCDLYLASGQVEKGLAAARNAVAAARGDEEMGPALGRLGEALGDANDDQGALEAQTRLLEINRRRLAADPASTELMRYVSLALRYRADTLLWLGEVDEARTGYEEALAIDQKRLELKPERGTRQEVSVDIARLADADAAAGDLEAAIARQRDALARDRAVLAEDPQLMLSRRNVARGLAGLANLEMDFGQYAEAVAQLREAVEIDTALIALDPRSAEFLSDKANDLRALAFATRQLDDAAEAERLYQQAVDITRQQVAVDPGSASARADLAAALVAASNMAIYRYDYPAALADNQEALAIRLALLEAGPTSATQLAAAEAQNAIGVAFELNEQFAEAGQAYHAGLALLEQAAKRDRSVNLVSMRAEIHDNLTDLASKTRDYAAAVDHARAAVADRRAILEQGEAQSGQIGLARSLDRLATALRQAGREAASLPVWQESIALRRTILAASQAERRDQAALAKTLSMAGYAAGVAKDGGLEQAWLRDAAALYRELARESPADYLFPLGTVLQDLARAGGTSPAERTAFLDERVRLFEHAPASLTAQAYLGGAVIDLAQARLDAGDRAGAIATFGHAIEVLHDAAQAYPDYRDIHRLLAFAAADRARLSGSGEHWLVAQAEIDRWRAGGPLPDDANALAAEVAAHAVPAPQTQGDIQ